MRQSITAFRNAAGICYEDRFVPIIESIVNIIASIILVKVVGLSGVFIGTIISTMILHFWSFPKYTYNVIFKRKKRQYIYEFLKYFFIMLIIWIETAVVNQIIIFDSPILEVIKSTIITFIVVNCTLIILYRKTEEYKYFKKILVQKITKIAKQKRNTQKN